MKSQVMFMLMYAKLVAGAANHMDKSLSPQLDAFVRTITRCSSGLISLLYGNKQQRVAPLVLKQTEKADAMPS